MRKGFVLTLTDSSVSARIAAREGNGQERRGERRAVSSP